MNEQIIACLEAEIIIEHAKADSKRQYVYNKNFQLEVCVHEITIAKLEAQIHLLSKQKK